MTFYHVGHGFDFELRNIARLFFPRGGEAVAIETRREAAGDGGTAGCDNAAGRNGTVTLSCRLRAPGFDRTLDAPGGGDEELTLCTLLYRLCVEYTGCTMDWGVLTGVRPIKLLRRLTEAQGRGDAAAYFRDKLLVSEGKLTLALDTMDNEDAQLRRSAPTSCSVYVAIPFCPTRCAYCSFVSQTVEQAGRLMAPYVEALEQEIEATGALISALGLQVETVYIGGGTPTALPAPLLRRVCDAVGRHLPPPVMREYTVEAGRPDTIDTEKLRILKNAGVTRLSINPQTLSDAVLEAVGRRHTAAQFFEAREQAARAGFDNINVDLIAGLPSDTFDGFCASLEGVCALAPASVTVHTLALKRAARLAQEDDGQGNDAETEMYRGTPDGECPTKGGLTDETASAFNKVAPSAAFASDEAVRAMVAHSVQTLRSGGWQPYYLYRQSRSRGNQENTGWARPGRACAYNIYMMDETHTILACGAGAVTKLRDPYSPRIERVFNFKYPYEYNRGSGDMLERKGRVAQFYRSSS